MFRTHVNKKLAAFVLCFSLTATTGLAANPPIGEISVVQGSVDIVRADGRLTIHAKTGTKLSKGDTIKTGPDSKAAVKLNDDSTLYVAANSRMEMTEHNIEPANGKRNVLVKALTGKIRLAVSKFIKVRSGVQRDWSNTNFSIETPTAVAGVRGTDLVVIVQPERTNIVVLEGLVGLRGRSAKAGVEIMLGANQSSIVKRNAPPSRPSIIRPQQRQFIISDTTPAQIAKKDGAGAPIAKGVKESAIANEVAANKPVREIIENAIDFGGMTVEEAVAAAIKAGADPSAVVYAAISSGYPTSQVVQAAIQAGAPLATVTSSASSAGADTAAITDGATSAGVPQPVIADSIAETTGTESPVYGYTDTTTTSTTTTTTTSGTGTAITSGPVATPGNTVASPSAP